MDAQPQEQQIPIPMRPPTAPVALEPEAATGVETESEEEMDRKIPEPDFQSFKGKAIEELEVEIEFLSEPHRLKNLEDVGSRVFWLNDKYKAKYKRKGSGRID